jgi:hypothetical protein
MDLKTNFYKIFRALNPYNYQELSEGKLSAAFSYFIFIIMFCVMIMFVLFTPVWYNAGTYIDSGIGHFDTLNVSTQFHLKDSFDLLSSPQIRFDNSGKNLTTESVLITPDKILYKHYLFVGSERSIPMFSSVDVTTSERTKGLLGLGLMFILPALFFWAAILSIIYFGLVMLLTYIIVMIVTASLKIAASSLQLLKLCVYSTTIFVMLQLLLLPFVRMFWTPLIVYWIFVAVVVMLWRDVPSSTHEKYAHAEEYEGSSKGSKSRDIFANKDDEGSFKPRHKTEKPDSYDVDAHGNMKSSAKRHRSVDEENEGYVELK